MKHRLRTHCLLALAVVVGQPVAAAPPSVAAVPQSPSEQFGDLFSAVQAQRLYRDSKTFADAVPRRPVAAILADWRHGQLLTGEVLRRFVEHNFEVPDESAPVPPPVATRAPLVGHIDGLWPVLTRTAVQVPRGGSALALPKPYVVPGGRFRELYYWDSYFTMLGLQRSHRQDLVENMIADFGDLIERYGHVPNGTRTYYLSRSQPPFFYLMAGLSTNGSTAARARRLGWMRAEHRFWMAGEGGVQPGEAARRVVRMVDGTLLNRYWDDRDTPRDESWREDVALAKLVPGRPASAVYRDIRAAAESGWDFSSRWMADGRTLATLRTTRIVPVDLNSLMYGMERSIASECTALGDRGCAADYTARADARQAAIERYLWNGSRGFYADYSLDDARVSGDPTAAMAFPLFTGVASDEQALRTGTALAALIGNGGLATTQRTTGQQWDAPNGWAPLQWVAVAGLRRYRQDAAAESIERGWLTAVTHEYCASGRLLEKYDVTGSKPGGGGEYPLQDGFGWTNGVTLAMLAGENGQMTSLGREVSCSAR